MPLFGHLLMPLDGSRLAEVVLPVAFGFAAKSQAKVTLLHVLERDAPPTVHGQPHLRDASAAAAYLDAIAARYTGRGLGIDRHVHANEEHDVAKSIVDHAAELGADLIALTPHGSGDLRRWLIGSIAQVVLQRGQAAVLLVPAADQVTASFELRNLLVPLDGQSAAEAVLPIAQTLAANWEPRVTLVMVVPTLATIGGDRAMSARLSPIAAASALDYEERAAQEYLEQLAATWPEPRPVVAVLRGEPAQMLLDVVEQSQPDLVLMSTHGRAGLAGLWAGSVATKVVTHATRPLLLVRPPGGSAQQAT